MKILCFLLFIASSSCIYIEDGLLETQKIAQRNFAKIEDVPYQAKILVSTPLTTNCGAVIIDKYWVLTCVHCIARQLNVTVETGTSYRNDSGKKHKVKKMIMHPDYKIENNDNDIALIKLSEPIEFIKVQQSIPIASSNDIPVEGQRMLISGFGKTGSNSDFSNVLKSAYVPVANTEYCAEAYAPGPITENMFCAGDGHADSCKGDSGGPAVINGKLYGIITGGNGCGSKKYPGIYARIHRYHDWIVETTGLNL